MDKYRGLLTFHLHDVVPPAAMAGGLMLGLPPLEIVRQVVGVSDVLLTCQRVPDEGARDDVYETARDAIGYMVADYERMIPEEARILYGEEDFDYHCDAILKAAHALLNLYPVDTVEAVYSHTLREEVVLVTFTVAAPMPTG